MLVQLVRFGLVGAFSTLVYAAVYWPLATFVFPYPVMAVPIAFGIALVSGFPLHSRWSFEGHGADERSRATQIRFALTQTLGLLLNMVFTWVLTGPLFRGPTWWPLVPAVLITPFLTFLINRYWVFA
ncbi:MAG: hypothetical protein QOG84_1337 [Sphingomonadales bacterium]|nr:hypothetical protein [Sphingomonadales bacterium]MEA3049501.1 hypothetical protein [Sphingomonadales bacterium]